MPRRSCRYFLARVNYQIRVAHNDSAIAIQKYKQLIGQRFDGFIDLLKIGKPDTDHDHPEECVVGAGDAFTEKDDVCSLDGINLEIIDVDTLIVIVFKVLKVGGTRNVNFRRWPFICRIHKPPIPVHQPNKFSLLQARPKFHQKLMRLLTAKNTINIVRSLSGANFFLTCNIGQNEID